MHKNRIVSNWCNLKVHFYAKIYLSRVIFLVATKFLASIRYKNIPEVNLLASNEIVWLPDMNSEFTSSATCSPNKL